jgi:hypothetical protein
MVNRGPVNVNEVGLAAATGSRGTVGLGVADGVGAAEVVTVGFGAAAARCPSGRVTT